MLVICVVVCCEGDGDVNDPTDTTPGSWVIYSPYKWSHDGRPYRSVYCDVFSDGASDEMKEKAGKFADSKFLQVLDFFGFTQVEDFRYPPGDEKVNVYINRHHEESMAAAYWGTIFITIRASDIDTSSYISNYLFRHELTHIFEFMIEGLVNLGTEDWFTEGIAVCAGGGLNRVNSVADLENWMARHADYPNQGNPISIKTWTDWPDGLDMSGYYTVWEVVIEYLLDERGLARSLQDVLNVLYDLRNGGTFSPAFEEHFGLPVATLEAEVFDRLRTYLSSVPRNH
ncbi:hypothetical protein ACFL4Y_03215 [Gemmatimonadota bacterium]